MNKKKFNLLFGLFFLLVVCGLGNAAAQDLYPSCTEADTIVTCTGTITGNWIDTDNSSIYIHDAVITATDGDYLRLNTTHGWINISNNVTINSYSATGPSGGTGCPGDNVRLGPALDPYIHFYANDSYNIIINGTTINNYGGNGGNANDCYNPPGGGAYDYVLGGGYGGDPEMIIYSGNQITVTNSTIYMYGGPGGNSGDGYITDDYSSITAHSNGGGGGGNTNFTSYIPLTIEETTIYYYGGEGGDGNDCECTGGTIETKCSQSTGGWGGNSVFLLNDSNVDFSNVTLIGYSGKIGTRGVYNGGCTDERYDEPLAGHGDSFFTLIGSELNILLGIVINASVCKDCGVDDDGRSEIYFESNYKLTFTNQTIYGDQPSTNYHIINLTNDTLDTLGVFDTDFQQTTYVYCSAPDIKIGNDTTLDTDLDFTNCPSYQDGNITWESSTQYFAILENPWLEVGTIDDDSDWNTTGLAGVEVVINIDVTDINTNLSGCEPDADGYCDVPLTFHSDTAGNLDAYDMNIEYQDYSDLNCSFYLDSVLNESKRLTYVALNQVNESFKFNLTNNVDYTWSSQCEYIGSHYSEVEYNHFGNISVGDIDQIIWDLTEGDLITPYLTINGSFNDTRGELINSTEKSYFEFNITDGDGTTEYNVSINGSGYFNQSFVVKMGTVELNYSIKVGNYSWEEEGGLALGAGLDNNISLDGLDANRSYEYRTSANITTDLTYITVYDDTNRHINQTSPFYYTIDLLRENKFNDSTTEKTITKNDSVYISLDDRTDIESLSFNITNTANYSENISIDVNQDNISDVNLLGQLTGNNLLIDYFYSDDIKYSKVNLSRNIVGIKTIYTNITTNGIDDILTQNFTFQLDGFNIDNGNSFSYHEFYNNTDYVNVELTTASTYWMWDDCIWNLTDYWNDAYSGSATFYGSDGDRREFKSNSGASCNTGGGSSCKDTDSDWAYEKTINFDAEESSRVMFKVSCNLPATSYQGPCGGHPDYDWCGGESAGSCVYYLSGTSDETIDSYSANAISGNDDPVSDTSIYELVKTNDTLGTWEVYNDGVYERTITITGEDVELKFRVNSYALAGCFHVVSGCSPGSSASQGMASTLYLYYVNTTGIGLHWNGTAYNNSNESLVSKVVYEAPTDIERVYLEVEEYKPTGTDITYEVSNNNGTNWQIATVDYFTVLETSGNNLTYRVNGSSNDITKTPRVRNLKLSVIPASVTGVTIDVGADGDTDWSYSETLNSTTSPQNFSVNGSEIYDYVNLNCEDDITCNIPTTITFGTGGIIQISNLNSTFNPNPINITTSLVETFDLIELAFSFFNGSFELSDLKLDFLGRKNITVSAHDGINEFNRTIEVQYSPFNVSIIPDNIDYWDIGPNVYSSVQTEITPFGNADGNGNPFFNITRQIWDHPIDVYVRYNDSVDSCATTWFEGYNSSNQSGLNITLSISAQNLLYNISDNEEYNVSTWTNISCAAQNSTLLIPYFCFFSMCTECVKTTDWTSNCEYLG